MVATERKLLKVYGKVATHPDHHNPRHHIHHYFVLEEVPEDAYSDRSVVLKHSLCRLWVARLGCGVLLPIKADSKGLDKLI